MFTSTYLRMMLYLQVMPYSSSMYARFSTVFIGWPLSLMCDHPKGFTSESIPTRGGSGSSSPPGGAAAGGGAGGAGGLPAAMVRGSPVCFAMYSTTWWPLHPSAFASAMSQPWRSGSMVYATMWTSLATPFSACASAIIARMPGCSCSGMRSPAFGWFSG
ncbi:hypothetical protein D3C71_843580 [compost metagenome]